LVSTLDRKLLRDLRRLGGQVVTIALVVAAGIASYVSTRGAHQSLVRARDTYYQTARFADVFARAKRAPEAIRPRLEAIPGVTRAETRVVSPVSLPLPGLPEPANGRVVSIPADRGPMLNQLHVRTGRLVEPGRGDEAVILEAFAEAHGLRPGDTVPVVLEGTLRQVRVVGTAHSPEYVIPLGAEDLTPDPKQFTALWMDRAAIGPAFDLDGAFNDVTLQLAPAAHEAAVLGRVDALLEPYGGLGAHGRDLHPSARMLDDEIDQLSVFATAMPAIFLGVAAFLLNVVLSRLVYLQRPQIAALKAVGYGDRQVGLHYLKLVSVIVLAGALLGTGLGAWMGDGLTEVYRDFFHFPALTFHLDPSVVLVSVGVSLGAAFVGALGSVRSVVRLPPAEAMQPPKPPVYHHSLVDRLVPIGLIGAAGRMVLRDLQRHPLRLGLAVLGIALAVAILVVGRFFNDAMTHLMDVHFTEAMREDLSVTFIEPVSMRGVRELDHLPGVLQAEGLRALPVRFRVGSRRRDAAVVGYMDDADLRTLVDDNAQPIPLPSDGIVLTRKLGEVLDVPLGGMVTLEPQQGERRPHQVRVAGLADEMFGLQGHMRNDALARLLGEAPSYSTALLRVDPPALDDVRRRLQERPNVLSVTRRANLLERFRNQTAEMILVFTFVLASFAATIAVGVVYNSARVSLSTRSRDLASLRVLGFTRRDVFAILLGELGVQVALAIPLGLVLGWYGAHGIAMTVDPETYRIPVHISDRTYAFATVVTLAAALMSALLVRRRLDRLDLIGVLKTRE
jgi:putative ABC transport system permease protein